MAFVKGKFIDKDLPIQLNNDPVDTKDLARKGYVDSAIFTAVSGKLDAALKGAINGVAELDGAGKVPSAQLPSYVDDVVEYANLASFPASGNAGIIYVALDTNKCYRWSGSAYIEISASPGSTDSLVEGSVNLYFTGARAKAAAVADSIIDGIVDVAPSQNAVYDALALKQNSLGTGTTSQFLRGDLTWQTVALSFPIDQVKHVAKNGNDGTADGSAQKPYLTISSALSAISDATPSKRYVIRVAAGNYTEASVSLKANVFIVGESKESVRVTGAVSMNADWNQPSGNDCRSGFSMISLLSAADFNWNTVTSPAGKLYFNEVVFGSTVALYGYNNAIAQAQFNACVVFGNMTISGINVGVFTNNICYANITLNQHPNGGMATILAATGGSCGGTLRLNTPVNDFNRRCSGFFKSFYSENLIIDGASSYADVDLDSQGKSSTQKINGGTLVALSPRINHDIETQMLKPITTEAHNLGDWGKQWMFHFAYVHASTGSDLYLTSVMPSYDPAGDTTGRSIFIQSDGYGLRPNVSGGNIELETAAVSGTGVKGKVQVKARELDMTSAKITNLANGSASSDAVNKGQLDAAVGAFSSVTSKKQVFTLSAGDITNGYVNCSNLALADSMIFINGGVIHHETESYTLSTVGGVTRITFDVSLGLIAGDKIYVQYLK